MTARTSPSIHQTPRINKLSSDHKVDCERGALRQNVQPNFSQSRATYQRVLALVGFLSLVLLLQLHDCYRGWQSKTALGLDDVCPQAEALTPAGHEALLESLDEEFGTSEFKLKAYESLGGAVRIP